MHKDWILNAVKNAPDSIDENMTIGKFVEEYSCLNGLVDAAMTIARALEKKNNDE